MTRRRALLVAAALLLGAAAHPLHHRPASAARARGPAVSLPMSLAGSDRFAAEPQEASRFRIRPLPPPAPSPSPSAPPVAGPAAAATEHRNGTPVPVARQARPVGGGWACVLRRESGTNYRANTGNGYTGAAQWLASTWNAAVRLIGHSEYANGRADLAPPAVQDAAAAAWQAAHGWGPWPNTSRACGLR